MSAAVIALLSIVASVGTAVAASTVTIQGQAGRTVTAWIQLTDSCKQALPGGTFIINGPGTHFTTAPTSGMTHQTILGSQPGVCPIQEGTCVNFPFGCVPVVLGIPSSGIATYTATVAKTANGFGSNLHFAICNGGSDCPHGPEVATIHVNTSGAISATVLNHFPDGVVDTWPANKATFGGTRNDPIMFHEYGIGNGSLTCDGDHDADDYLTGTRGAHCNSDRD